MGWADTRVAARRERQFGLGLSVGSAGGGGLLLLLYTAAHPHMISEPAGPI